MKKIVGLSHHKIAHILNERYILIKPLIYSRCYFNEWPLSYLHRLAHINGYSKINWLIQDKIGHSITNKIKDLLSYKLIYKNDWSSPAFNINGIRVLTANPKYINLHTLRICPQCVQSNPYIRYEWMFLFSNTCLKHHVLLHDSCPNCDEPLDYFCIYTKKCRCGKKIKEFPIYPTNEACNLIQHFIENKKIGDFKINKIKHITKLKLLYFFFFIIHPKSITSSKSSSILMQENRLIIEKLAKVLFYRKNEFWHFLNEYIYAIYGYSRNLMSFYRLFNRQFKQSYFSEYKSYLNEFINLYWRNHITDRNSLFSKSILANHSWLPISEVKKQFNLSESLIIKATIKGLIHAETIYNEDRYFELKKTRYYRLYYKPDIIKNLQILQETISFKTVCKLLGTTKKQLKCLIQNDHFSFTIAPEESYLYLEDKNNSLIHLSEKFGNFITEQVSKGNSWLFLKSEVEDYLQRILKQTSYSVDLKDSLTLPDAMRVIGNKIKEAYNQIITAIINKEIPIFMTERAKPTLRDIYIPTKSLIDWINQKTNQHTYMTIPQMAKHLSISQQFAYELVNYKLMPYTIIESNNTRWITKENINAFNKNYMILSKLAKEKKVSSKELMKKLDTTNEDYQRLEYKLKQAVYKKLLL